MEESSPDAAPASAPAAADEPDASAPASAEPDDTALERPACENEADPDLECECPVCMEPAGAGCEKTAKEWPAGCKHVFCSDCWGACIQRDLRCPMCRAEAPESARPVSRAQLLLSSLQLFRLRELERLRAEEEARRRPAREPRTRVGRWVKRRVQAADRMLESVLGLD